MIIKHKYIASNPIQQDSKALILGTIYPSKNTEEFMCDFFYGNEGSIWNILGVELDKEKIVEWLKTNKIAISDTILETEREDGAKDHEDKFKKECTVYNTDLVEAIKNSSIETIYFTSDCAFELFKKNICEPKGLLTLPKDIDVCKTDVVELFNRQVALVRLPSPSPNANVGLANNKEYKKEQEKHPELT